MAFDLQRAFRAQAGGKALPDHPVFHDNVPVSVYAPGASRQDALISQREANLHMDAYGGNQAIDYLMDGINLYSDTVATAKWRLMENEDTPYVREKNKNTPPEYKVGPADLYRLLDQPNEHMAYHQLMELLIIDLLMVGNGYWLKWGMNNNGQPLALFRLAPQYVKIIPGAWGPKRYEYQPQGRQGPAALRPGRGAPLQAAEPQQPVLRDGPRQGRRPGLRPGAGADRDHVGALREPGRPVAHHPVRAPRPA